MKTDIRSETVRLGDVADEVSVHERDPEGVGLERYVGLDDLDPGSLEVGRWGLIKDGTSFTKRFWAGQLLFAKRRAYQKKAAVADFDGLCSGDLIVIQANAERLLPELLPFLVHTERFFEHALKTSSGSLSPRTKWKHLAEFEFQLPPVDEQTRIVEILNAVNEASSAAKSVAQSAVSILRALGDTVATNGGSTAPLSELIDDKLAYGASASSIELGPGTMYYVRVTDINNRGSLYLEEMRGIPTAEGEAYILQEGDFLFARSGATAGKTYLYRGEIEPAAFAGYVIRARPDKSRLLPGFLDLYCRSSVYERWVEAHRRGGAQPNINAKQYGSLEIPLLALDAQERLVEQAECARAAIDAGERHIARLADLRSALTEELLDTDHA